MEVRVCSGVKKFWAIGGGTGLFMDYHVSWKERVSAAQKYLVLDCFRPVFSRKKGVDAPEENRRGSRASSSGRENAQIWGGFNYRSLKRE